MPTGRQILTLYDARRANNYSQNKATFNPTDDLVLSDGVLWDAHTGQSIHKFDKFNPNISGVFHPNSLEIVINSEVVSLLRLSPWRYSYQSVTLVVVLSVKSSANHIIEVCQPLEHNHGCGYT